MQYNVRTARLIEAWFSVTSVPPLFLRVIRNLHRAAWKENRVMVGCCDKPLAWIREVGRRIGGPPAVPSADRLGTGMV